MSYISDMNYCSALNMTCERACESKFYSLNSSHINLSDGGILFFFFFFANMSHIYAELKAIQYTVYMSTSSTQSNINSLNIACYVWFHRPNEERQHQFELSARQGEREIVRLKFARFTLFPMNVQRRKVNSLSVKIYGNCWREKKHQQRIVIFVKGSMLFMSISILLKNSFR